MKEYGGVMLEDAEADALLALEQAGAGPIPRIPDEEMKWYLRNNSESEKRINSGLWHHPMGFYLEQQHVAYLYVLLKSKESKIMQMPDLRCLLGNLKELGLYIDIVPEWLNLPNHIEKLAIRGLKNNEFLFHINFGNMRSLHLLDLSWNGLMDIPESIWEVKSLHHLYLYNNNLTSISRKICQLKELERLHLNYNKLTHLPECIGNLQKLYDMWITSNDIEEESIPKSLYRAALKRKVLFYTDFGKIPSIPLP